jgi:dihydrofolate reductase
MIHPVILGGGKRLFEARVDREVLKLVNSRMFATGVVYLTYRPADEGKERLRHV